MAVNDVDVQYNSSLANGSYENIQPSGSDVYMIHTICASGSIEVYYDSSGFGTTLLESDSSSPYTIICKYFATNSRRIRIKNVSGGSITVYTAYSQVN